MLNYRTDLCTTARAAVRMRGIDGLPADMNPLRELFPEAVVNPATEATPAQASNALFRKPLRVGSIGSSIKKCF